MPGAKGDKGDKGVQGAQGIQGIPGAKGADGTTITAADILTKLKTVDGSNSGIDADFLDGHSYAEFSLTGHTHVGATTSAAGFMSAADKTKLNSVTPIPAGLTSGYVRTGQKVGTKIGTQATAEGIDTTASGEYSHAEGYRTKATGGHSHAEGYTTEAIGWYSHAAGFMTEATADCSTIVGKNGQTAKDTLFAVGNGQSNLEKSLAFEVKSTGAVLKGGKEIATTDHTHTPAQVGLGNVNNTADSAKSVANAAAISGTQVRMTSGVLQHYNGSAWVNATSVWG